MCEAITLLLIIGEFNLSRTVYNLYVNFVAGQVRMIKYTLKNLVCFQSAVL